MFFFSRVSSIQCRSDAVRDLQPSLLLQRRRALMMPTRTALCQPLSSESSVASRKLQSTSLVAVTQFTSVALTMESMLLVFCQRTRAILDAAAVHGQFPCCPQSAFDLAFLAPVENIIYNRVGCPVCIGERQKMLMLFF